MPDSYQKAPLRHVELIAYLLAAWSFVVLFLEPIIGVFLNYRSLELATALANLLLLMFTILNHVLFKDFKRDGKVIIFDVIMLLMGALLLAFQAKFAIFFLLIRQTYFIIQYVIFKAFEGRFLKLLSGNPPVSLMLSFVAVIIFGTVLLMLPAASVKGQVTHFLDALFTATSATCVTGLVVVDTGTYFTLFGQIVILLLIQIGGLGIMTISTAFALMLGQRITLKLENVMHNMVGEHQVVSVFKLLQSIVLVTAFIEAIGAVFLYVSFAKVLPTSQAIYNAIFHSVSAFCNAGFALWSDNMMSFVDSPVVNLTITFLIILGGLGFTVLIELYKNVFSNAKVKKLTLHTKIVLASSAGLTILGFIILFLAEYHASMEGFTLSRRLLGSWFQSVTMRTAGFNTIDIGRFSSASVLVALALMFIGASPGSTGGGVKTTTFSVLLLSVVAMLRGKRNLTVFNRKIATSNAKEATTLITIAAMIVFGIVFFLMMLEPFTFEQILFESISAFGTVGLSMGITSSLSYPGKAMITLLMYIGRIGPLTMIYAFSMRTRQPNINYAEEKIAIG
ncbi:MAG: potassium transporter Trk [Candidatus Cloacimonetes bacterium HGW-Cloacimonetes-3]|jgi:trk system potassium uptake protein TrkH|nr:MAG: potassium transporter Trk [Candidatus Cloacimonetes bacterium HGW-Cloacimonetes-3]